MALIQCSECGKKFSEYANKCPNCGCPIDIIEKENTKRKELDDNYLENRNIKNEYNISLKFGNHKSSISYNSDDNITILLDSVNGKQIVNMKDIARIEIDIDNQNEYINHWNQIYILKDNRKIELCIIHSRFYDMEFFATELDRLTNFINMMTQKILNQTDSSSDSNNLLRESNENLNIDISQPNKLSNRNLNLLKLANDYYLAKKYTKCIQYCDQILLEEMNFPKVWELKALCTLWNSKIENSDVKEAKIYFQNAINLFSEEEREKKANTYYENLLPLVESNLIWVIKSFVNTQLNLDKVYRYYRIFYDDYLDLLAFFDSYINIDLENEFQKYLFWGVYSLDKCLVSKLLELKYDWPKSNYEKEEFLNVAYWTNDIIEDFFLKKINLSYVAEREQYLNIFYSVINSYVNHLKYIVESLSIDDNYKTVYNKRISKYRRLKRKLKKLHKDNEQKEYWKNHPSEYEEFKKNERIKQEKREEEKEKRKLRKEEEKRRIIEKKKLEEKKKSDAKKELIKLSNIITDLKNNKNTLSLFSFKRKNDINIYIKKLESKINRIKQEYDL